MDLHKYQLLLSIYKNCDNIALLLDDDFGIVWSNSDKIPCGSNLIGYLPKKYSDNFALTAQKIITVEVDDVKYAAKICPVSIDNESGYFAELYSPVQAVDLAVNSGAYNVIQNILADVTAEVNRLFDIETYSSNNIEVEKDTVVHLYKTRSAVLNTLLKTLMNTAEFFENKKGEYYTGNINYSYVINNICSECNRLNSNYMGSKFDKIIYPEHIPDYIINSNIRKLTIVLLNIIGILLCGSGEDDIINVSVTEVDGDVLTEFSSTYIKGDIESINDDINIHLVRDFVINSGGKMVSCLENGKIIISITFHSLNDDLTLESDKFDFYSSDKYTEGQNSLIKIFYKGLMNLS